MTNGSSASARALMIQGTGSDVGKSVLVAGLCRAAHNRGLKVLPFKPQNMSNNAAVAADGEGTGEIGRAQWLQAVACKAPPSVHMNPVLLKPQSDIGAQVVVQGKVRARASARDYQDLKASLMAAVMDSWARLTEQADLIMVEGAGSPAEINLRARDIANMGFATEANVPVVLVGDIDRGGVIAALAGTHLILPQEDRRMIAGYIINKFRGDVSLFDDGIASIEAFTGWPCFGVVPWLKEVAMLPAEDAVVLEQPSSGQDGRFKVVVPMLSRIANFDDLDPLRMEPGVEVVFVPPGKRLPQDAGLVIVPGTKSTIADLLMLRANGWDRDIESHHCRGGHVIGICGGYQILGRTIADPDGIEGEQRQVEGLGLLDIHTVLEPEKIVREATALSVGFGMELTGYEIHMGRTSGPDCDAAPFLIEGRADGARSPDGKIWGTYLHGLFSTGPFRRRLLQDLGARSGAGLDHMEQVDMALDALAAQLERHLDIDGLLAIAR